MNHTPTPWNVEYSPDARFGAPMADANSTARAKLTTIRAGYVNARERPLVLADAFIQNADDTAFIVQACNSHDALVDALEAIRNAYAGELLSRGIPHKNILLNVCLSKAEAALKLAKGE